MNNAIDKAKLKLYDQIEDAFFVLIISEDNDYILPYVSASAYKMFEIVSNKVHISTVLAAYERIHDDDKKKVMESLTDSVKGGRKWNLIFKVNLPEKGICWFELTSKRELHNDGSISFYGRITDVSKIKRLELSLKFSEDRLKSNLELSSESLSEWEWDVLNNSLSWCLRSADNLEFEADYRINSQEDWEKNIHADDLEGYNLVVRDLLDNKTSFYEYFHRVKTFEGNYKWIFNIGTVLERDADGKPLKIIGTHTDVSSQKTRELELEKKLELITKKNNRLLNFSNIVSHNLKSYAGNFKLLLDVIDLEGNFTENEETIKYLRKVSNDFNETIEDLSQIVNIQNDREITTNSLRLNDYLIKVLGITSAYGKKNEVTIINNVSSEATVDFNPAYLESVLQNLFTNAVKYSDPKKRLKIEFDFFLENNKKVLTVKDNGLGIDLDKYSEKLFGMYSTFHTHEKGNGIGLYITKSQIEAMKGSISVESQIGVGTKFKIVFND